MSLFLIAILLILFLLVIIRGRFFSLPILFTLLLVVILPILWAFGVMFFDYGLFDASPKFVGLRNLQQAFSDKGFRLSVQISSLWTFLKTTIEFFIAFFLAVNLRKLSKSGKIILFFLGIGWFLPSYISVSAWRAIIQGYGSHSILNIIFNTGVDISTQPIPAFIASLFVNIWLSVPMTTLLIIAMLQSVSKEIFDNLSVDGAKDFVVSKICFASIRNILIPFYFFQLARGLKGFTGIFLLTGQGPLIPGGFTPDTIAGSTTVLSVALFEKFQMSQNYGTLAAYSVLVSLVVLLWLIAALVSKTNKPERHKKAFYLVIIAHLAGIFYLNLNLSWLLVVLLYVISLVLYYKKMKAFRMAALLAVLLEITFLLVFILRDGWQGINPSSMLSIPLVVLSLRFRTAILNLGFPRLMKWIMKAVLPFLSGFVLLYVALLALSKNNTILPDFSNLTIENFSRVFFDDQLWINILNTLKIAGLSVMFLIFIVLPFSYSFSRSSKRFNMIIMTILLFGSAYTGMHTLLPLYMLFDRLNLVNTFSGIALVVAVQVLPVGVIALSSFLRRIPREFREVAMLNGMKEGSYLLKIILPLSLPLIVGIVIFAIVSAWNAFTVPLIFIDKMNMLPFSIKIYEYAGEIGSYYTKWNLFGAASLIGIVPLIFLYRRSQKFLYTCYLSEGGVNYE